MTGWAHGLACDDRRQRVTRPGLLEVDSQEVGDRRRASKETRFPWLHAREIRHLDLGVAYHFPVRVGGRLDVPVVGLVVDRGDGGDGGHGRGGRHGRPDGRVLLLNRHVGQVGGCWGWGRGVVVSKCVRGQDVSRVFRKSRGGAASGGGRRLGPKKGELESCSQLGCSFRPCVDWLGRAGLAC